MNGWTPRFALAALALTGTLCCAQTAPGGAPADAPRGATHDCSGMTGTALSTCLELNRSVNTMAPTGAGTPNDCSGMTGPPLDTCRRLNSAETAAPRSSAGTSEDCTGQVGDALAACRALNGLPSEPEARETSPTGGSPQQ
jgi:hypothetical protein